MPARAFHSGGSRHESGAEEASAVLDLAAMSGEPTDPAGDGPVLQGSGIGWPPVPEDPPPAPEWVNGRAFPAVWRDTLAFATGSLIATRKEFPQMKPGRPWNHRPPVGSDADIEQAIAAKIHLSLRLLPLLASAELAVIEPTQIAAVPDWRSDEEEAIYSSEAVLPRSPVFLDFEAIDGEPAAWERETWPLPFYLRGALCWAEDEALSIVPFGSVGGRHPWGGTDYQAWARWIFLQGHSSEWPDLGRGDFIARANGEVRSWVDGEQDSVCAQQGSVTYNLCRRVLSVLMFLEAFEIDLIAQRTSRQVRRRAERKGERIGLVPETWPAARPVEADVGEEVREALRGPEDEAPCPIPKTHARLNQCHAIWHEALDAYAVPDTFVGRLNALIQGLRTVTFVLQKELGHRDGFGAWYEPWQTTMRADKRMQWLVSARNRIEKQGDLDTSSVAHVRVMSGWGEATLEAMDVDPTATAQEIARRLQVFGLPAQTRQDGVLVVERRWTLEELAGDEILDVLAHCHGVLTRLVEATHERWGSDRVRCELSEGGTCEEEPTLRHPSGRLPCMAASRPARTAHRDLQSGALITSGLEPYRGPALGQEDFRRRYGSQLPLGDLPRDAGVFELAEALHRWGRRLLTADGAHVTIAWLLLDGRPLRQITLRPEDQQSKLLGIKSVAEEVEHLGANEIIFTTEAWEATVVGEDDSRAQLRPGERDDRVESFLTYALRRGESLRIWRTVICRSRSGEVELEDPAETTDPEAGFLLPIIRIWDGWPN